MTPTQHRTLQAVANYWQVYGVAPTRRDVAAMLGRSMSRANQVCLRLQELGYLERRPWKQARSLRPTALGRVALEEALPVRVVPMYDLRRSE